MSSDVQGVQDQQRVDLSRLLDGCKAPPQIMRLLEQLLARITKRREWCSATPGVSAMPHGQQRSATTKQCVLCRPAHTAGRYTRVRPMPAEAEQRSRHEDLVKARTRYAQSSLRSSLR